MSSTQDVQSFVGLIYTSTVVMGVIGINTVIPSIMEERASFYRERAAGFYSVFPMVFATTIAELPFLIFASVSSVLLVRENI